MKSKISLSIVIIIIFSLFNISYATDIKNIQTGNSEQTNPPEVFAESAILLDIDSNKILYEKNSKKVMYPASTTKLLTAILTVEKFPDLSQKVNVSYYAVNSVPYSYATAHLVTGEQISLKDLLYALLVPSANDAAYVLAQFVANSGNNYPVDSSDASKLAFENSISTFSQMMNSKAKELGCTNTNFINPNGIHDENHYTTAYDLMLIGRFAYNNSVLRPICKTTEYTLENTNKYTNQPRKLETTNDLISSDEKGFYPYANGLKTGFTDPAQSCIIASASKDNRNLVAIILHSEETKEEDKTRESDCKRLFEYGFNNFSYAILAGENSIVQNMEIFNGSSKTRKLDVLCSKELKTLIVHDQIIDATPEITINKKFAPIAKGEVLGTITYNINGETFTSDLIAEHDVESIDYLFYIGIIALVFLIFLIIFIRIRKKTRKKKRTKKPNHF